MRKTKELVNGCSLRCDTNIIFLSPLVVSLSLTKKVPRLFCRFKRSLSESRRVIFPKYHLPKWATQNKISQKGLHVWRRQAKTAQAETSLLYLCENSASNIYFKLYCRSRLCRCACNTVCAYIYCKANNSTLRFCSENGFKSL